jgi:hypothetical protein
VAGITVLVDAGLFELSRIGRSVRVVATRTGQLAFSHRHVRRAHELGPSLQVTLTANFGLRPIDKKRRDFGKLGQLFAAGFFHQRVAVDTGKTSVRVRARFPIGLHTTLMAAETSLVLHFCRLARIFTESDHPTYAFAAAGGNMVASRAMAIFAGSFFCLVARIVEKYLAH